MKNIRESLDQIEQNLQRLFEEKLIAIFTLGKPQSTLIDELMNAMREKLRDDRNDGIIVPDNYIIHVPPEDIINWNLHRDLFENLAETLEQLGVNENFQFTNHPTITCVADPNVMNHLFTIEAAFSQINTELSDTAGMTQPEIASSKSNLPNNAFLIIGGTTNFPLNQNVIDIGRHSDNDLILDNPYVSRHHAQLRAISHRFVIIDVGSTGGIFINGRKMNQATLQAGDVIRIGMINLIYVQDTTSANPTTAIPSNNSELHSEDQKS
jgi:hypothetical protein